MAVRSRITSRTAASISVPATSGDSAPGTRATASSRARVERGGSAPAPDGLAHDLQEVDVLLLLQEHAQERQFSHQALPADVALHEHRDPVDELARRRTLAKPRNLTELVEGDDRLVDERSVDVRVVHPDDAFHPLLIGKVDEVKDAPP